MVKLKGSKDKVRRKYAYSFARQYLEDHKIKIFNGDTQVLKPVGETLYKIKLPNTRYRIGEQFAKQGEIKKIYKFEELQSMGFVIISQNISMDTRWDTGQKIQYVLKRSDETGEHLNKIPKDHFIEYDPYNRVIRLIGPRAGPLGYGIWVPLKKPGHVRAGAGQKPKISSYSENPDRFLEKQMMKWTGVDDAPKHIKIPEAAFMITESNEIVCLPNTPDMPSLLISGMKGSGKCLIQDSNTDFVLDGDGKWTKISEKPKTVLTLNNDLKLEKARVKKYFEREVKEALRITVEGGKTITVTKEHPFLTSKGWKPAEKLKEREHIASPRQYEFPGFGERKYTKKRVRLIAYMYTILRFRKHHVLVDIKKKPIDYGKYRDLKECLAEYNRFLKIKDKATKTHVFKVVASKWKTNSLEKLAKELGIHGKQKREYLLPKDIMGMTKTLTKEFMNAFFSNTGYIRIGEHRPTKGVRRKTVNMTLWNINIARQIQHLLLRLGIRSRISGNSKKYVYDFTKLKKGTNTDLDYPKVNIEGKANLQKFISLYQYNLVNERLRKQIISLKDLMNDEERNRKKYSINSDYVPIEMLNWKEQDWRDLQKEIGYRFPVNTVKTTKKIHREYLEKLKRKTNNELIKKHAESDLVWQPIRKIERITGTFKAWDIEVDHPAHNFVANDIIVHNSFCLHSLVSRLFWKPQYNYKIVILNDSSRETGTWCLPNKDIDQINVLKRLNEHPLPLPTAYFHPSVKEDYEKLYMGDVGFDITIPFKEIILNHRDYLNLKDSSKYFTKIMQDLLECDDAEDAEKLMEDMVLHYNIPPQTANKIRAELDTLFDSKMTDISIKGHKPWWTSKNPEKKYNPYTASVHAGILPILQTEFVSNDRKMLSIYFKYFAGDLFNRQKQDRDFTAEQSEILFVVDEAHNISSKGLKSGADMLLRRSVREGRPRRIGTLLATQKFSELPNIIKDNTTHLIVFKNPGEANEIVNQYNMGKHMVNVIKELDKHQMVAYTTDHFVVYDSNGKKRRSNLNEVFIGKTLPPYSMHKRPKISGGGQ